VDGTWRLLVAHCTAACGSPASARRIKTSQAKVENSKKINLVLN
jgi:hypothetical protein